MLVPARRESGLEAASIEEIESPADRRDSSTSTPRQESMIRSGIGTDPEVLRHPPLAQRVAGAECRDQFSRPFSSRENYFLLTFPLIEQRVGQASGGSKNE